MSGLRSFGAHAVTALATLGIAAYLFGRPGNSPLNQIPRPGRASIARPAPRPSPATEPTGVPEVSPPTIPDALLGPLDAEEQVNIRVYTAVNRGVVNVTTAAEVVGFFGDETSSGSGSGFVIDKSGHILTNFHVIENAIQRDGAVQVTLHDGTSHDAKVVGFDASTDVAVLVVKCPASSLFPVSLGESGRLAVGQKVLAVGNPFGLERTLTTGIISSLDRSIKARNGRSIRGIIQTDAAINPGNSGGPLLNTRGEVIGMNTAILSQVGQSSGIGFAVPINGIKRILKSLIEVGRVIRADLGIKKVYKHGEGLLILELDEDGPGALAGLRPIGVKVSRVPGGYIRRLDPESADLIVAIDGVPVKTVEELLTEVEKRAPGDQVTVKVYRLGRFEEIPVVLGQL